MKSVLALLSKWLLGGDGVGMLFLGVLLIGLAGCAQGSRGSSGAASKKPVAVSQAGLRQCVAVETGGQSQEALLRDMTAGTNPAVVRFNTAITFYLNFRHRLLNAAMSGGSGAAIKVNGPIEFRRGLYGNALETSSSRVWQKVIYTTKDNIDLGKPGGLAVWVSAHHWSKPGLWDYFLTGRDDGRFFMLAPTAVYMIGAGPKGAGAVADWNFRWETGQWHLLVFNWKSRSFMLSLDGNPWVETDEPSLAKAAGPPGHLCVVEDAGEPCLIGPLLVFNRPLTMREIRWLYRQGGLREKLGRKKSAQ
jgi:hypothetical protein